MNPILNKYAKLLINYCLDIKAGDRLYVKTTTLAEPLVRELYREALKSGANTVIDFDFREKGNIYFKEAQGDQLNFISPVYKKAIEEF